MQSQPLMFGDTDDLAAIFAVAAAQAQQQRVDAVSQMDITSPMPMQTEEPEYFPAKPQRWNSCSTATTQESWYSWSSSCTPGTCTPCTPLTPILEPRKKRVRFCTGAPDVVNDNDMILEPTDGDECWWDEDYLLQRNKSSKRQASTYAAQHPEFAESIHALMHSYNMANVDNAKTELQKHLRVVRNANTRGLEARIVPALKVYRWHNIQDVLMAQERLRQQGILKTPKGEQYLRQTALQVSRPARQLAFRLAQADQLDAKKEHATLE